MDWFGPYKTVFDLFSPTRKDNLLRFMNHLEDIELENLFKCVLADCPFTGKKPRLGTFMQAANILNQAFQKRKTHEADLAQMRLDGKAQAARMEEIRILQARPDYPGKCKIHNIEYYWKNEKGYYCPLCEMAARKRGSNADKN